MYFHYTFRTYKGKSSLLSKEFKDKLSNEFGQIAQDKGFKLLEFNIMEDHVHLLIWQDLNDSTNYVMRMFKGISSRRFFQEYPSNRLVDRKLWGRGYHAREIGEKELPGVVSYIKNGQFGPDGYDKRYKKGSREVYSRVPPGDHA
jgi:putative transposase